jgi:hypothetical protein
MRPKKKIDRKKIVERERWGWWAGRLSWPN